MDLRQLEMLLAVVECGGYKNAGENLHISHSAVHRRIRILEQEIEDRVFVRVGKRMKLTKTGELVVDAARRIGLEIARVQAQIRDVSQLESGHLRIGTATNVLIFFLPRVLDHFRRQFPKVTVSVKTGPADHMAREVRAGGLDIGIIYAPAEPPDGDAPLECEILYEDEFVLVAGDGHPLRKCKVVTLAEAARYPFVFYQPPSHVRRILDRLFEIAGLVPQVVMEVENEEAVEKMVGINAGIAFLSRRRATSDRLHQLRLRGQAIRCEVGLVFPRGDYLPPAAREFARICREVSRAEMSGVGEGRGHATDGHPTICRP